jgi:hypothetical protein
MANLYKADGTVSVVTPSKGSRWTLGELQGHVGGCIELMPGLRKVRVIMNQEAALRGLPVNRRATDLVLELLATTPAPLRYVPVIRGDVLVLTPGERM